MEDFEGEHTTIPATIQARHDGLLERLLQNSEGNQAARRFPLAMARRFKGADFSWLHHSWADFVQQKMSDDPRIVRWLRYYLDLQVGDLPLGIPSFISQKKAARELGVSEGRLKEFVTRGILRATAVPEEPTARQWQLIEGKSVEILRTTRLQYLSILETSKMIGTTIPKVVSLVAAGLLNAVQGPLVEGSAVWRFDPATVQNDVRELIGHLPVISKPSSRSDIWSFPQIHSLLARNKKSLSQILLDVKQGLLPMGRVNSELRFSVLLCEEEALRAYQKAIRQQGGNLLSVNQVCERLSCKPLTLRSFYKTGLLIPANDSTDAQTIRHQYAEEDLVVFLEQYITSDKAAEVLGVTQLTVQAWARSGRITALTGPDIDGSHTYLFDKTLLIQWRYERLNFGETMELLGVSKATLDRWANQGRLTPLEDIHGKQRWFVRSDVERLIQTLQDV